MTFQEVFDEMLKRYEEANNKIEILSVVVEEQEAYISSLEQKLKHGSRKKSKENWYDIIEIK